MSMQVKKQVSHPRHARPLPGQRKPPREKGPTNDRGWGGAGAVGWGVLGAFGSLEKDTKAQVVRKMHDPNVKMVKNEKGLWVKVRADAPGAGRGGNITALGNGEEGVDFGLQDEGEEYYNEEEEGYDDSKEAGAGRGRSYSNASLSPERKRSSNKRRSTSSYSSSSCSSSPQRRKQQRRHYSRSRSTSRDRHRSRRHHSRSRSPRRDSSSHRHHRRDDRSRDRSRERDYRGRDVDLSYSRERGERYERKRSRSDERRRRRRDSSASRSPPRRDDRDRGGDRHKKKKNRDDKSRSRERGGKHKEEKGREKSSSPSPPPPLRETADEQMHVEEAPEVEENKKQEVKAATPAPAPVPPVPKLSEMSFTAAQLADRLVEVYNLSSNKRLDNILACFSPDVIISVLKSGTKVLSGHDALGRSMPADYAKWQAECTRRLFIGSDNSSDPTFCLDYYPAGHGPGFNAMGKGNVKMDTALLYQAGVGPKNTIEAVWIAPDRGGIASSEKEVTELSVLSSNLFPQVMSVIKDKINGKVSYNFNDYSKIETWG